MANETTLPPGEAHQFQDLLSYAEHGIADYWIVNLPDRCVEVHRQPVHDPASGHRYGEVRVLRPGDSVAPLAAPQAVIAVNDLLP